MTKILSIVAVALLLQTCSLSEAAIFRRSPSPFSLVAENTLTKKQERHIGRLKRKIERAEREHPFPKHTDRLLALGEYLMNRMMTAEFFTHSKSPCLKRFYQRMVRIVVIKESSIPGAGRGVFAARNIPKGTIVAFYPVHKIRCRNKINGLLVTVMDDQEEIDERYNIPELYKGARRSLLEVLEENTDDFKLSIHVNPRRDIVKGWTAHLINDGATVQVHDYRGVAQYWKESIARNNCHFVPFGPSPLVAAVATKNIQRDEELFVTYGDRYWLRKPLSKAEQLKVLELARVEALRIRDAWQGLSSENLEVSKALSQQASLVL